MSYSLCPAAEKRSIRQWGTYQHGFLTERIGGEGKEEKIGNRIRADHIRSRDHHARPDWREVQKKATRINKPWLWPAKIKKKSTAAAKEKLENKKTEMNKEGMNRDKYPTAMKEDG